MEQERSPPHVCSQSDNIPRDDHQPDSPSQPLNSPPHVPHSSGQFDNSPCDDHQPDSPSQAPHVLHSSGQFDNSPCDDHQPDSPSHALNSPPHVPHGRGQFDNSPCDDHQPDSPPHVPQLEPPPLKRRKYKGNPPKQKNQFAYQLMLSLREEQNARKRSASSKKIYIIDIDTCNTTTPLPKRQWIQNELITLYESERDIKSGGWLTDDIIDAAQKILAAQFKARFGDAGFQSVGLRSTFSFEVESEEFVQVLHNGHNHWLTISSVGTTPGGSQ